jgi:hypothetical protein
MASVHALTALLALLLSTTPALALTSYVALTGSDSAPGTREAPYRTLAHGLQTLRAGDTLLLRGGTYGEIITGPIAAGTSWSHLTTIAAAPGETVILQPPRGPSVVHLSGPQYRYIAFDRLIFDASHTLYGAAIDGPTNLRFSNGELRNATYSGFSGLGDGSQVINMRVHHNGNSRLSHGFYICSKNVLILNSDIYANSGYGIQVYYGEGCASGTRIVGNRIHHNQGDGGVVLGSGEGILFANNRVYENDGGGLRPLGYGSPNTHIQIACNAFTRNRGAALSIRPDVQQAQVLRNVLAANAGGIEDAGVGTVLTENVLEGIVPPDGEIDLAPGCPLLGMGPWMPPPVALPAPTNLRLYNVAAP